MFDAVLGIIKAVAEIVGKLIPSKKRKTRIISIPEEHREDKIVIVPDKKTVN